MRRWRGLVVVGPLLGVSAVLACADLGNLSGGGGADASDAGPDGPAAPPDDAAPVPPDASSDDRCPDHPGAIFCDEFDQGALGARWSQQTLAVGGALALDTAAATSPPNALLATTPADPGKPFGAAALDVHLGAVPPAIHMQYDLWVDAIGSRSAAISALSFHNGAAPAYDLYLFVSGNAAALAEDGTYADGGEAFVTHPLPVLPLAAWVRVILDVDLAASTATVTLEQPPGTAATPALDRTAIAPTVAPTSFAVSAGLSYSGNPSTAGWRVRIDNFIVEGH